MLDFNVELCPKCNERAVSSPEHLLCHCGVVIWNYQTDHPAITFPGPVQGSNMVYDSTTKKLRMWYQRNEWDGDEPNMEITFDPQTFQELFDSIYMQEFLFL